MGKKRRSVLTDNLDVCIITGRRPVDIHHVFGGPDRKHSEEDGFIIPLVPSLHTLGKNAIHKNREMDLYYKRLCQAHFERYMGTREEFRKRYRKSYL